MLLKLRLKNGEVEQEVVAILSIDGVPYVPQSDIEAQLEATAAFCGQLQEKYDAQFASFAQQIQTMQLAMMGGGASNTPHAGQPAMTVNPAGYGPVVQANATP